jgi:hypothetical protein
MMRTPELIAQDHLQWCVDNQDDCFFKPEAELYGVTDKEQFVKIASAKDVYALLEITYSLPHNKYIALAIHVTGLASPFDEDDPTPPSEREDSRRVSLITITTEEGMGSALAFSDTEEIITDEGEASGGLAEALLDCWFRSAP